MLALVLVAASVGFSNLAASIGVGTGGIDWGTRLRIVLIFGTLEAGMPIVGLLVGHDLASAIGRETRWLAAVLLAAVGCYGFVNVWRLGRPGHGSAESAATAPMSTGPASTGPVSTGPVSTGPVSTGPVSTGPVSTGPDSAGSVSIEPVSARPTSAPPATGDRQGLLRGNRRQSIQLLVSGLALSLDNLVAGFAMGAYQVNIIAGAVVFGVVSVAMSLAGLEFGARIGGRVGQRGELIGNVVLVGVGVAIGFGVVG